MKLTLGKMIAKLREAQHITQKQLARAIMISVSEMCRIEKDDRMPRFDLMERIAEELHCTLDAFSSKKRETHFIQVNILPLEEFQRVIASRGNAPKAARKRKH